MTNAEIGKLVADYFARTSAEANDEENTPSFIDYDSEDGEHGESTLVGLELHISDMMENLARGQHETVAHLADHILEEAGIELEKKSHEYRQLCRETLGSPAWRQVPPYRIKRKPPATRRLLTW